MTRLQRFRAYMARMNPVADPETALREGLYVDPPGRTVANALATRLELEPTSTHLVLGGIGSGKTSEVLRAAARTKGSVADAGDLVEYCDVSRFHDVQSESWTGVLTALVGLSLADACRGLVPPKTPEAAAVRAVRHYAHGRTRRRFPDDDFDFSIAHDDGSVTEHVAGVLKAPDKPLPDELAGVAAHIRLLKNACLGEHKQAIFLFDSLDRLADPERFREAVEDDLRALKSVGIGVVVVGPIRFMAGVDRAIANLFDETHYHLAAEPARPEGHDFLVEVLRRRAGSEMLPDACLEPLARASGGVLRDLISLAKRAGEEAYAFGNDYVTPEDVARAADAFGRALAVGLDDAQVKLLRHIRKTGGFVIRGERELSLIETGRVLLYEGPRWVVHPTLAPLLDAMPEVAA
ncbi:hypothetical protein [Polyangium sp. 15x6]|uniref:hypothetical protein n=1 Tax=Polyangium sp. 15x6 TaxID=3042687 RepID=UPI00249BC7EA|nr:hypothetical protein [Polyangium sp. 15x6]MDI3283676.1 hypothetical protein [Polyangium sp. 15x6]